MRPVPPDGPGRADGLRRVPESRDGSGPPAGPSRGEPAPRWPRVETGGSVALAIGPEGGFTDAEAEAARDAGWRAVGLGPTLLRIETAALAASSIILNLD